jgi:hypothetical protein
VKSVRRIDPERDLEEGPQRCWQLVVQPRQRTPTANSRKRSGDVLLRERLGTGKELERHDGESP